MRMFVPIHTVEGAPWDMALVEVTEDELELIFNVAKVVEAHDATSVNRVDMVDAFTWGEVYENEPPLVPLVTDATFGPEMVFALGDDWARISTAEIVIARDSVHWEFYVKHVDARFSTHTVGFELLSQSMHSEQETA